MIPYIEYKRQQWEWEYSDLRETLKQYPLFNIEPSPCDTCPNKGKVCHCTLGGPKIT